MPPLRTWSRAKRRLLLAALFVVAGSDGLQDAVANGDTRTLSFFHLHTRDSLTVTFKRNGQFDEAALAKLNRFLRDWRNDDQIKMEPRLFDIIWQVYQDVGGTRPIEIISAYRSPATNSMLRRRSRGVAKASQHTLGRAMDFNIPGVPLEKVRNAGLRLQRGGVGFYPSSGSPFVHLDVGSVRHWPRLSPDALARVFPDGRTVHIPSNGRPMPGYALALADIARRGASPSPVAVAAAADAGVTPESESRPQQSVGLRTWFSRVFSRDEDAAPEPAAPRARERAREPVQVATAVPMPPSRPQQPAAAPRTTVASVETRASASEVIASRGFWSKGATASAEPLTTGTATKDGPRLVWQVGPQPATANERDASAQKPLPPSRSATPAVTASAAPSDVPWPDSARDRVPSELALAYAATASAPRQAPSSTSAAPMGSLRPAAHRPARAAASPPAAPAPSARAPAATHLAGNPWLRGLIVAPSMQRSVGVTLLGPQNYLALTPLLHKPSMAVANSFAADPAFGLSTAAFHGRAVAFVPALDFRRITVGLR